MRLLLAGGGTGGHLVPGTALAREVLRRGGAVMFLTAGRAIEAELVAGFPFEALPLESGGGAPGLTTSALRMPRAVLRARAALTAFRPDAVIGLGGLASFPAVLAARSLGVPTAQLEINAVPGRATRMLAPWVRKIFVASPQAARLYGSKAVLCGMPLREGFRSPPPREQARLRFGLDPHAVTMLIVGGSQGAGAVNAAAAHALPVLAKCGAQVVWAAGPGKEAEARAALERAPGVRASVHGYLADAPTAYAAADFALCRSGAATVLELAAAHVPSITIPYPHHRDKQQLHNARLLGEGSIVIEERELTPEKIADAVRSLATDAARRTAMGAACARAAYPNATETALEALAALGQPRPKRADPAGEPFDAHTLDVPGKRS